MPLSAAVRGGQGILRVGLAVLVLDHIVSVPRVPRFVMACSWNAREQVIVALRCSALEDAWLLL